MIPISQLEELSYNYFLPRDTRDMFQSWGGGPDTPSWA